MSVIHNIFFFIVAIGVLVTFHEFGHFWVARKLGVKVLRFSVGFGKPLFSWPAFIPVTFALGILGGVFGSVFGMLALNQLPQFYHPLFNSERFKAATDDKFFISIVADDPKYDREKTMQLLKDTGASAVEFVEND